MSISINTADYIKTKNVEIDGVEFKVTPLSTADSLALVSLSEDMTKEGSGKVESTKKLLDIMYSIYDDQEKARQLLGKLPMAAMIDITRRVMED